MILSWGKPGLYIRPFGDNGAYTLIPTPVENSSILNTEKGEKKEAPLEGGAMEDVRYLKNKYSFEFEIRVTTAKTMPFTANDGVVSGEYELVLVPEDNTATGFKMDKAHVSTEDTWSAEDGGKVKYTLDALEPSTGDQVKWGTSTVTSGTETGTYEIVFTEKEGV